MKTLVKNELRLSRRVQLIWLGLMLLLVGFCYFEFLSLRDSLDEMAQMINTFPRLLMLMFGVREDLNSALGWYGCLYFWTGILAFAYAVYLGISCVAKETERGTAEYLFTKPVCRTKIVLAKVFASVIQLAIFAAFTGICNDLMLIRPMGGLERAGAEAATAVGMFLTQLVLFALGLLLASLVRKYKTAVRLGAAMLLAVYGIGIGAMYTGIRWLDLLSPLRYFDVYEVAAAGISLPALALSAAVFLVCVLVAVKRWNQREI